MKNSEVLASLQEQLAERFDLSPDFKVECVDLYDKAIQDVDTEPGTLAQIDIYLYYTTAKFESWLPEDDEYCDRFQERSGVYLSVIAESPAATYQGMKAVMEYMTD